MTTVFECTNVTKIFNAGFIPKPVTALSDVSFTVPKGRVTGFLGPNGSGKSTLLKIATELIKPTSGSVTFFGGQSFYKVKAEIGFVPEKPAYSPNFKGIDILRLHGSFTNVSKNKINEVVRLVDLEDAVKRAVGTYSKGMQQRLAIAQALLHDPKLLILDEPLSGLDPDGREILINVIKNYSKQPGKSVFLSSHLLEDLQRICNNLVVIHQGKLLFSGDPSTVFNPNEFKLTVKNKKGIEKLNVSKEELYPKLKHIIENGDELHEVRPHSQSIKALYFELMQKQGGSALSKKTLPQQEL